jgi:hypothetical protein
MASILEHVVPAGKHGGADDPVAGAPLMSLAPAPEGGKRRWKPAKVALAASVFLFVLIMARKHLRKRSLHRGLAENGWVLYTKPGCGHCISQMKALGGWYKKTVVCSGGRKLNERVDAGGGPACDDPSIPGYPYWFNAKGKTPLVGLKKGWELEEMAGVRRFSKKA